jgi:TRAP-type C4-dicarboxylate transport system permease small subunit
VSTGIKTLISLETKLVQINKFVATGCGSLIFIFMFIIISDVLGRTLFRQPFPGTLVIGENVLAGSIFLSLAYVLIRGEHIRVTVILDRLSPRSRAWFDIFASLIGFLLVLLITWQSFPFALRSYELKEVGIDYPIPLYIGKFAYFAGFLMFCLEFFLQFLRQLITQLGNPILPNERESG